MTKEELLRPRVKVIAPFPGSRFTVGDILYKYDYQTSDSGLYCYVTNTEVPLNGLNENRDNIESMPHLFEPLPWWKDRKLDELPEYVKWDYKPKVDAAEMENYVREVEGWQQANFGVMTDGQITATKHWLPATKEEYEAYIKANAS